MHQKSSVPCSCVSFLSCMLLVYALFVFLFSDNSGCARVWKEGKVEKGGKKADVCVCVFRCACVCACVCVRACVDL